METKTKKPGFRSNVVVRTHGVDLQSVRDIFKANPEEAFLKTKRLVDEGKLRWSDFSGSGRLRGLFDALYGVKVRHQSPIAGRQRAITSGAFPLLSGELSAAAITEAYESVDTVGEKLTTQMNDPKKFTHVAELKADLPGDHGGLKELDEYPLVDAGERRFTGGHYKDGLRMAITEEMIAENDVAGIEQRLNFIGEYIAKRIERRTIRRICDYDGSKASPAAPYVLTVDGSGTALYSTSAPTGFDSANLPNGTRKTNNALADDTNLTAARKILAGNKDTAGHPVAIPVSRMYLFVPDALLDTALKILNSELIPGEVNTKNPWGPGGTYRPMLISTPYLDEFSTTAWYLGDFARQFTRKVKMALQNVTLGAQGQAYLERGIMFQARASADVETFARAAHFVLQNLTGTTAPADE